jgi:hypothetical protein
MTTSRLAALKKKLEESRQHLEELDKHLYVTAVFHFGILDANTLTLARSTLEDRVESTVSTRLGTDSMERPENRNELPYHQ